MCIRSSLPCVCVCVRTVQKQNHRGRSRPTSFDTVELPDLPKKYKNKPIINQDKSKCLILKTKQNIPHLPKLDGFMSQAQTSPKTLIKNGHGDKCSVKQPSKHKQNTIYLWNCRTLLQSITRFWSL